MDLDEKEFVSAVYSYYARLRKRLPQETPSNLEVANLGLALATLGNALEEYRTLLAQSETEKGRGVILAAELLDCLTTGTQHTIWRYTDLARKSHRGRPPPGEYKIMRRALAVGLLRAVMRVRGERSEDPAAKDIADACAKRNLKITSRQLKAWNTDFQTSTESKGDPLPDTCAKNLFRASGGDESRIIDQGLSLIEGLPS